MTFSFTCLNNSSTSHLPVCIAAVVAVETSTCFAYLLASDWPASLGLAVIFLPPDFLHLQLYVGATVVETALFTYISSSKFGQRND